MRSPSDLNERQYTFLRKLRAHGSSLPVRGFPRPATLRRWLRKPRFRKAMLELRAAMNFQRDLMFAGSAAAAAKVLQGLLSRDAGKGEDLSSQSSIQIVSLLAKLVRLDHLREKERKQTARAGRAAGVRLTVNVRDGEKLLEQIRTLAEQRPSRRRVLSQVAPSSTPVVSTEPRKEGV